MVAKKQVGKTEKEYSKTPLPPDNQNDNFHAEKELNEIFKLWIPEPLENLEVMIHSKKRILEALEQKTENIDTELKQSIFVRDQQINTLNKNILGLKTELKTKDELIKQLNQTNMVASMQKQVSELLKVKEKYEENFAKMKKDLEASQANWYDEKDSLMLQQEAIVEEQQGLIAKINAKDNEISSMKEDILQLSKIIGEMNSINKELQLKLESLNTSLEETSKKLYQAQIKSNSLEGLETNYMALVAEKKTILVQLTECDRINSLYTIFIDNNLAQYIDTASRTLSENIKSLQIKGTDKDSYEILLSLQKHTEKIASAIENLKAQADLDLNKKNKNIIESAIITENENKIKELELKEKTLLSRLHDSALHYEKAKKEFFNTTSALKKLSESFKDQNFSLTEKNQALQADIGKKESEIQKLKSKTLHQNSRYENILGKNKELIQKDSENKVVISSLQSKINSINEEKKNNNSQLAIREKRVKAILAQIQILREEIFNKDSEILKKSREILKLEEISNDLKAHIQRISSKMKISDAETLNKISGEIEAKDKQIAMLKEMLRSSNLEVRAKETSISHYKKKSENFN
jgi:DNA repair exonuclease SbcCD ATPase subunit